MGKNRQLEGTQKINPETIKTRIETAQKQLNYLEIENQKKQLDIQTGHKARAELQILEDQERIKQNTQTIEMLKNVIQSGEKALKNEVIQDE